MRLLGKRFVRESIARSIAGRRELRDAILWEVYPNQRRVFVRVQGSNQNVVAYYPRHWTTQPDWMKIGSSVRIAHVGGSNRIEVMGVGAQLPTLTPSSPPLSYGGDGVMTGLGTHVTSPESMFVWVEVGTYRMDGIIYEAGAMPLGSGWPLGSGAPLGDPAATIEIDPPGSNTYRFDAIVLGTDGVFDYLKGAEAGANPQKPMIPGGHILVGDYMLIYPGMTVISASDLGRDWTTPTPSSLRMDISDPDIAWGQGGTTIFLWVLDQYNRPYSSGLPGFYFLLSIAVGNGTVSSVEEGSSTSQIGGHGSAACGFTYTRDMIDPGDWSPTLMGEVQYSNSLVMLGHIILRNAGGEEMPVA